MEDDPAARLRATATARGDHVALRWQDRSRTWSQLDGAVDEGVAALGALGITTGDRVALVLGTTPVFVEVWFAVLRLGAVAVPLAPTLADDEIAHALHDAGVRLAVVEQGRAAAVAELGVDVVAAAGAPPGTLGTWPRLRADAVDAGRVVAEDPAVPGAALAALLYTSGTTGRPRGAMLSRDALVANQDQSLAGPLRLRPDDVLLLPLPLFHVYALNVGLGPAVAVGAGIVLLERFDVERSQEAVETTAVTVVLAAPAVYLAWVAAGRGEPFADVRLAISGAAALPVATFTAFEELTGLRIREGYGLTEAGPAVTSSTLSEHVRPGAAGQPLPGVELRVVAGGRDVGAGEEGEILVRSPALFDGYWGDEEATAAALDADGWLHTGDIGILDADGWLHLVDRRTDVVIVSGFNVYPAEVERVLTSHPDVAAAAVVGAPHPTTGESVSAYVVRSPGSDPSEEDLLAHCATRLARYKQPATLRLVDALPTTVTGKVRRVALR